MKNIILDLNGILLLSEPLHQRVERVWKIDKEEFLPVLKTIMEQVRQPNAPNCYSLFIPHLEKWNISVTQEEFLHFWFSGEKINQEMLEYVKDLKEQGNRIYILSNNFKERTLYYQQHFPELFQKMNKTYFSWETGFVKPDPKAWQNILTKESLQPNECIYFDDAQKNIESAENVGIHALIYTDYLTTKQEIEKFLNN